MSKKKNKDDRKVLTLRYRIDENNHVSFIDPCCDEIPARLFFNLMKATSDVEEEWNSNTGKGIDIKAEELIEKESAGIYNTNEPIISKSKALEAVNMARKEEQERAFKVLEFILDEWVHGGDAECILEEFKEELEVKI